MNVGIDLSGQLSNQEKERLYREKRILEQNIRESLKTGFGNEHIPTWREKIKRLDDIVESRKLKLTEKEKSELLKEKEELENYLSSRMCTAEEMNETRMIESARAVNKEIKFMNECGEKAIRLKQICKALDPDDPTLTNLERLRDRHVTNEETIDKATRARRA